MFWESLVEFAASLRQTCKEYPTETLHVQSCGPFKLKLTNVVLDYSTAILQEQITSLEIKFKVNRVRTYGLCSQFT